jgi:hypothetical protein
MNLNNSDFAEFLKEIYSVLPTLLSVLTGSLLTLIFTGILNKRERKWKIYQPVIIERINVHKELLKLVHEMTITKKYLIKEKTYSCLFIFQSLEKCVEWHNKLTLFTGENSIWFSGKVFNMVYLFNSYQRELLNYIQEKIISNKLDPIVVCVIGEFLFEDYFRISGTITSRIASFFSGDFSIFEIEKDTSYLYHHPDKETVEKYFEDYKFYSKRNELESLIQERIISN